MECVVVVNSETMGHGDSELGKKLVASFFRKLAAGDSKPDRMIFYNSGVKLLAEGSVGLDGLVHLARSGVDILACGTCVEFFELSGKLRVGRVGTMDEIARDLVRSERVVTIS